LVGIINMPKLNWNLFLKAHGGDDRRRQELLIHEWLEHYGLQLLYCGIVQESIDDYFRDINVVQYKQLPKIYSYLNTLNEPLLIVHSTYRMVTKHGYNLLKKECPNCSLITDAEEAKQRLKEQWFKRPKKLISNTLSKADEQLLLAAKKDLNYANRLANRRTIA